MPDISIVTVCFNSARTIRHTLTSVAAQSGVEYEHVVVDGASSDDTAAIVRQFARPSLNFVSEPDNGIYDAMNKGLNLASGELVAFLNSDDCYADPYVLRDVVDAYRQQSCDFVYGDLHMVDGEHRIVRDWKAGVVPAGGLRGSHIPHPVLFVRRELLCAIIPAFDRCYPMAADVKQQLILINKMGARGTYIERPLTIMQMGGASTAGLARYVAGWIESARAYNEVMGRGGTWFTVRKVASKLKGLRALGAIPGWW